MFLTAPNSSSRVVTLLFVLGLLGALVGLAGLALTAVGGERVSSADFPSRSALHPLRQGDKYGYADSRGRMIIPARFDMADAFSEGLALVREDGRFGYINTRGSFAIPAQYRHAFPFRDGFAAVRNGGQWLLLDRFGHTVARQAEPNAPLAAWDDSSR